MNYSQIINDKMNLEIRNRYANILEQEYDIVREPKGEIIPLTAKAKKEKRSFIAYMAAAMLIVLLGASMFFANNNRLEDPKEMIHQYLASNHMADLATTRSNSNNALLITPEQKFHQAMNLLLKESYREAVNAFQICESEIQKEEPFYQETKVYLIMSLILNDQNKLAKSLFSKLPTTSWEKEQLRQIMDKVE